MSGYGLKRWFASAFGRLVLRVRSGGIWKGASFQVRPTHVSMHFASAVTGHGIALACALAARNRDLHSVQFLSDAGRTHRVAEHVQPLAQVLQAAERHITDRDMSPDSLWGPVINGPDLDGVDTPSHPLEVLHRKTGVEHMLTKQENYRDPEAMAQARFAQRLALVPGTCEEVDE